MVEPVSKEMILLLGHGSRNREAQAQFLGLVDLVRERVRPHAVQPGFLELASPSTAEAIRLCAEAGAESLLAIPVFLSAASHVKEDLPGELEAARLHYPQLSIEFGRPLGMDKPVQEVLLEKLWQSTSPDALRSQALLLVGRGSPDPEAARDMDLVAEGLRPQLQCHFMATAYVNRARPNLSEGLEACRASGASGMIILPCLFFPGIVLDRIHHAVSEFHTVHPGMPLTVASTLGPHPKLADLVVTRIHQCSQAQSGRPVV